MNRLAIEAGSSFPLGPTFQRGGVNFSVYSRNAELVELLLFEHDDDVQPSRVVSLEPLKNRTYFYWHGWVHDLSPGQLYGFRAHGPFSPDRGLRYDPTKTVLDPYARLVAIPKNYSRQRDANFASMKSVVVDPGSYDWEGDRPLRRPFFESVIYEMHVRGFTRHPSSGLQPPQAGSYAGLVEKIPYLTDLGITAVELMPVFQFDATDAPSGQVNYWGYSPVSFFAPHRAYSSRQDCFGPLDEFRDMVKALHRAGIEVILDVVFNHTAEGNETGPTFCFRGLDNAAYYLLSADRGHYADYTGTGNTLNANHPIVRRMILDSLRYWVSDMHVDGFRFDLASVLTRDEAGNPMPKPPIIWDIESDPVLAGTKMIAEAWDAAGLYQVGSFAGDNWHEWNGRFRDDARRFLKGDQGSVRTIAPRLLGSPDIYAHERREPEQSINFITCHDGFTLNDLVSYNDKHNLNNGEANRDGADCNFSWNCGVEGPTDDAEIERLRGRQIKNALALNLLAVGTPMLLMGDEMRRTQHGNNNAYCQDNEISWLNWELGKRYNDIYRFVKMLIAFRTRHDVIEGTVMMTLNELLEQGRVDWHGTTLHQPDWREDSRSLALTVTSFRRRFMLHVILNAYWEPLTFQLPNQMRWHRWIDTSLQSPNDICQWDSAPFVPQPSYKAESRSVVILIEGSR